MPPTYTHVAQTIHTGYRHVSNRLAGHTDQKPGKRHACNKDGRRGWTAVCGEYISAEQTDEFGGEDTAPVVPAMLGRVTCKRCLARKPVAIEYVEPTRQLWAVLGTTADGGEEVYCYYLKETGAAALAGRLTTPIERFGGEYRAEYTAARCELRTVPATTNYCG